MGLTEAPKGRILDHGNNVDRVKSGFRATLNSFYKEEMMSRKEDYEARTETLLQPIVEACGVSIYDVEYVKEGNDYYLRAYIDKPEGVTIDDCENVSRALSDALDREDFIPEAYILEVSSPGLGRTLKKDKHLQSAIGEEIEIKLFKPIDKCKEFSGILLSFDEEHLTIEEDETERTFERAQIALIRLAFDF
jgi:ribosome maturation factor RimP